MIYDIELTLNEIIKYVLDYTNDKALGVLFFVFTLYFVINNTYEKMVLDLFLYNISVFSYFFSLFL